MSPIPGKEYVHAIGAQLESCRDGATRAQLARLLATTGSPDAQPYLLEAVAVEPDDAARQEIRRALAELERRQAEG